MELPRKLHRLQGVVLWLSLAASLPAAQILYQKSVSGGLAAVDPAGNIYLYRGGATITKLDPNGNQIYSKPLPLTGQPSRIAADAQGNVVIVGVIYTDDLATNAHVFQPKRNSNGTCIAPVRGGGVVPCSDAYVAKIGPDGNLAWASYLGGSQNDDATAMAVDVAGNIYVAGWTLSNDFPTKDGFQSTAGGAYDGFVTEISPDGARIVHSSYIGAQGNDQAWDIAVDAAANVYVAGSAGGGQFPVTAGSFGPCSNNLGAFLIKVAPSGNQLAYGGCLGPNASATSVALDSNGAAYLGGYAINSTLQATPGAFQSAVKPVYVDFIAKISPDGGTLIYTSVFNGSYAGIGRLAVDSIGAVYASGSIELPSSLLTAASLTSPIPFTDTALEPCFDPSSGILPFLMKLNPAGSELLYFSQHSLQFIALSPDGALYEEQNSTASGTLWKIANLEQPSGAPFLASACVLNGASLLPFGGPFNPGISPGQLVALKGSGLGPQSAAGPALAQNVLGTSVGGVQVTFDGVPAPLIYGQDSQINAIAPYAVARKTETTIQVQYQGRSSTSVTVPVAAVSLGAFTDLVTTAARVFNQDFSVNSASEPAAPGSTVVIFVTGAGQTVPASIDGQVWQTTGSLAAPVSAVIQAAGPSIPISVMYAGPVPGVVSAVQQLNIQIPAPLPDSVKQTLVYGPALINITIGTQTMVVSVAVTAGN